MWRWINEYRLVEALANEDELGQEALLDALEQILDVPFDPYGVEVHPLRVPGNRPERFVAWLPRGYVLTYQPHIDGPPPLKGPHVSVLAISKYEGLEGHEKP